MKFKLIFYFALLLLAGFEVYKAFLILPFPGSQHSETAASAWTLYHYRWYIRAILVVAALFSIREIFSKRKWIPVTAIAITAIIVYLTNFMMTAESLFHDVETLAFTKIEQCQLPNDALVIGVTLNGESKAYPIRYISFHHQVQDTLNNQPILVTYCDVCRSGIVYSPIIDGKHETFRLVGMDQFNAMFEDESTGSWWRQVNGIAVSGPQKGKSMPVIVSEQLTLQEWSKRHPLGKIMLPDPAFAAKYASDSFEKGLDKDPLTRTDTASWKEKSWVVGIVYKGHAKAYDWNQLKKERVIYDTIAKQKIVLTIDSSNVNFFAYVIPDRNKLGINSEDFLLKATNEIGYGTLEPIYARQVFWHTWRTFYPNTTRYELK